MALQLIPRFHCLCCGGIYACQQPDSTIYHHACPPLPPDENGVVAERPDKRDENFRTVRGERLAGIKSEGMGVKCLTSDSLTEPPWITALNARIAKENGE
jgi:hypothetical protein